jgi:hypothetical protein
VPATAAVAHPNHARSRPEQVTSDQIAAEGVHRRHHFCSPGGLLIAGDCDLAFPKEVIEETARLDPRHARPAMH